MESSDFTRLRSNWSHKRIICFRFIYLAGFLGCTSCAMVASEKNKLQLNINNAKDYTLKVKNKKIINAHGIDVSHYQQKIDWAKVKTNNQFVFIKATEGTSNQDKLFRQNATNALENGFKAGAYHFYHPDQDANQQADFFLKTIADVNLNLPPVLDVEQLATKNLSHSKYKSNIQQWLDKVEAKVGCKPIFYTNHYLWKNYFSEAFAEYPLWLSEYDSTLGHIKHIPWIFWQYTQTGSTIGVQGKVDLNYHNDSHDALTQASICRK